MAAAVAIARAARFAFLFLPGEHDARNANDFGFDIETRFFFVDLFGLQSANVVASRTTQTAARLVQASAAQDARERMGRRGEVCRGGDDGRQQNQFRDRLE
jgi:hypothetical protein